MTLSQRGSIRLRVTNLNLSGICGNLFISSCDKYSNIGRRTNPFVPQER